MQEQLTPREQEIFDLLLNNAKPKEIAAALNISFDTVRFHQKAMYKKLGVNSVQELLIQYLPEKTANANPLAEQPFPADFKLALNDNAPWGFYYIIDPDVFQYNGESYPSPFKLGKGNRLVKDDIYHVTCFFTSNVDMDYLGCRFLDLGIEEDNFWTEISGFHTLKPRIKANIKYCFSTKIIVTQTASGASPAENKLQIFAPINTINQPRLTFHKFEVAKIPYMQRRTFGTETPPVGTVLPVQPLPIPFVLTLYDNTPFGWQYTFDPDVFQHEGKTIASPFKLGKGSRIVEDDIFLVTCFFTSNIDMDWLQFVFVDTTIDHWTELSAYQKIKKNIKAHTAYAVTLKAIATRSASGASPAENQFILQADFITKEQPTLTFTKFEVVKIS